MLDFDDLIGKTNTLLTDRAVAQWVLFRLDGGIDHVLVDEAQDTSPTQWSVIRQLTQEFTAGDGAKTDTPRTIFVVGDRKQSIYSFQGAAPEAFNEMRDHFAAENGECGSTIDVTIAGLFVPVVIRHFANRGRNIQQHRHAIRGRPPCIQGKDARTR